MTCQIWLHGVELTWRNVCPITFTFQTALFLAQCCLSGSFPDGSDRKLFQDRVQRPTRRVRQQVFQQLSIRFWSFSWSTFSKEDILPWCTSKCLFFFFVSDYSTNLFTSSITPLWSTPSGLKKKWIWLFVTWSMEFIGVILWKKGGGKKSY